MQIQSISADELVAELGTFIELIRHAVADGASLGFLAPLSRDAAHAYWLSLRDEIRTGSRLLLVARANGRIVGTGQLALARWPNAQHRAEVQKLVVDGSMRGLGVGQALMAALHEAALALGRTLIVLGTRQGGRPLRFYERLGYRVAGVVPGNCIDAEGNRHASAMLYRDLAAREPADVRERIGEPSMA